MRKRILNPSVNPVGKCQWIFGPPLDFVVEQFVFGLVGGNPIMIIVETTIHDSYGFSFHIIIIIIVSGENSRESVEPFLFVFFPVVFWFLSAKPGLVRNMGLG